MASESTKTQRSRTDGSKGARDTTPALGTEANANAPVQTPVQKVGRGRPAGHAPAGRSVPEREYTDYVLHYDENDATGGKIPDLLLDVPLLKVDEIDLEVDDLGARPNVSAEVLQLAKVNVGADVQLGRPKEPEEKEEGRDHRHRKEDPRRGDSPRQHQRPLYRGGRPDRGRRRPPRVPHRRGTLLRPAGGPPRGEGWHRLRLVEGHRGVGCLRGGPPTAPPTFGDYPVERGVRPCLRPYSRLYSRLCRQGPTPPEGG